MWPLEIVINMAKYRKKPVVVEAKQVNLNLLGFNPNIGGTLANNPFDSLVMRKPKWYLRKQPMIKTLEG